MIHQCQQETELDNLELPRFASHRWIFNWSFSTNPD